LTQTDPQGEVIHSWATPFARTLPAGSALIATQDGQHLIVGTEKAMLARFDLETGSVVNRVDTNVGPIRGLLELKNGRVAVRGERGGIQLWDT
jgi:hypothetical protein